MARKRNQKRARSRTVELKRQLEQEKLADEKDRAKKRMDPTARALLLGDLVFLAVVSVLDGGRSGNGVLSPTVSGICTVIGVILLIVALWLQFRPGGGGLGKGPRL